MSWDVYTKVIDEAKKFVSAVNLFSFGEPTMHKELGRMIRYAKAAGMHTRMHSNITLLNDRKCKEIIESGLDYISLSFDGVDKESHEHIRQGSNFETTLANVHRFLGWKQKLKSATPYTVLDIKLACGDTPEYKRQRQEFNKQFDGLPVDEFAETRAYNWAGVFEDSDLFVKKPKGPELMPCPYTWASMTIRWNGEVAPCFFDHIGNTSLGDVKTQTLRDIWYGSKYMEFRQKHTRGCHSEIDLCKRCDEVYPDRVIAGVPANMLYTLMLPLVEPVSGPFRLSKARKLFHKVADKVRGGDKDEGGTSRTASGDKVTGPIADRTGTRPADSEDVSTAPATAAV
jgi:radical SAM protein with 4Fe4S-binding SPASM domain